MAYPYFDRSRLKLRPLKERNHDLKLDVIRSLDSNISNLDKKTNKRLSLVAQRMVEAREKVASVVLMMGAHVLRAGVQRYLINLMERGLITHVAMNGAGSIHDYEFALVGATTESVAHYVQRGDFGLWEETAHLNNLAGQAVRDEVGLGEAIGREISEGNYPHKKVSVLAAAYCLGIPTTVHVGMGYDIVHQHPNADGSTIGKSSYQDFLVLAKAVENLEGGVLLNFGTAVMGPEVFLKALSMARNVARQENRVISHFTTLVTDLVSLDEDVSREPSKDDPHYYFRPLKTLLVRTVADGGEGFYVKGDHGRTFPNLYAAILRRL